ncbi:MAG: penicillin-binding protein activator [Hyphomicrobiales bacterium]
MFRSLVGRIQPVRRRMLLAIAGGLLAAGCLPQTTGPGFGPGTAIAPETPAPSGQVFGTGSIKIAMLVPLSAAGNAGNLANNYKNAADLAIRDLGGSDLQVIVKDSGGTSESAQAAASQALAEGAELILGPIFSHEVTAVGAVARQAGVPVVGFSTDVNAATRGVYVLSFLPRSDVERVVSYAASQGKRSFAAIVPSNAYGAVVAAEFQQAVARNGGRVMAVEQYAADPAAIQAAVQRVSAMAAGGAPQVDAILIPDGGSAGPEIARQLSGAGVSTSAVKLLGSGQWDDGAVQREPALAGAWFPAPDKSGFNAFSGRYRNAFGSSPIRIATNGYDAVILAAALARSAGAQRFTDSVLTNPNGFSGVDGIFRFRGDGSNDRGLAVYEIGGGSARVIDAAPRSFSAGGI